MQMLRLAVVHCPLETFDVYLETWPRVVDPSSSTLRIAGPACNANVLAIRGSGPLMGLVKLMSTSGSERMAWQRAYPAFPKSLVFWNTFS